MMVIEALRGKESAPCVGGVGWLLGKGDVVVGARLELFARAVIAGFGGWECDSGRALQSKGCIPGIGSFTSIERMKQPGNLKQVKHDRQNIFGVELYRYT